MTLSEISAMIGAVVAVAGLFGALFAFALRATMAPVKMSVDNLATVMQDISSKLHDHGDTLIDHGQRIIKIETIHDVRGCAEAKE